EFACKKGVGAGEHRRDAGVPGSAPRPGGAASADRLTVLSDDEAHATGSENWTIAPCGSLGAAQSRPPCASMIERLIDSPMPMPPGLVVKNALNAWSRSLARMPTPVSCTATLTPSSS